MLAILLTFLIVILALVLFITEKFSVDLIALIILSLLMVFGLISPEQSLAGFSSPATITVAAMFVLSGALRKTGVINLLAGKLQKSATSPKIFTLVLSSITGSISAFINNTAAVAILLPTVLSICKRKDLSPSKFLIPLSYAAQFGGVCTLIGTSTNLLVSAIAVNNGLEPLSMFEFSKLGIILFIAGLSYFLLFGKYVLPNQRRSGINESYQLGQYVTELRIQAESSLIGKTLLESNLGKDYDVSVLEVYRGSEVITIMRNHIFEEGDILLAISDVERLVDLKQNLKLEIAPDYKFNHQDLKNKEKILIEVLIAPNSNLSGQSLASINFQKTRNAIVIAIRRRDAVLRNKLKDITLKPGDELLLLLPKEELNWAETNANFIVLKDLSELNINSHKMYLSLMIIIGVVLLAAFGIMPILQSSLIGCVLMILTNCMTMDDAYQSIDWKVIILLAGILPLGLALDQSGAIDLLLNTIFGFFGSAEPIYFLIAIYLITTLLTECISNNAAAVLLAPLGISIAESLAVNPEPFLIAVCFAASTSFITPVGYQTNTMIYAPGNYKFKDFIRAGIPLNLIFFAISTILIPRFWPF